VETTLVAVEASAFAHAMRSSVWLYPLANVLHVLAAMGLFACVAAMDVKVLRSSVTTEASMFIARLRPVAIVMLITQVATGAMLLLPEASHIAPNPVFLSKLVVILLALLNVLALEAALRRSAPSDPLPMAGRLAAGASLGLWLAVAALGRLIAYF
jgi:hypothetical protein